MKRIFFYATLTVLYWVVGGCAPGAGVETVGIATMPAATATTPTVEMVTPNASETIPSITMTNPTALSSSTSAAELAALLELAAQEMRAAESTGSLTEARRHAETTVNLLVGKFGRWYGDQDGDGTRVDPSKGRGVLPGEVVTQGADLDNGTRFPAGLALLAAGKNANAPALVRLLGDTGLWSASPRGGYDAIEVAVRNFGTSSQLDGLEGSVPRAVAFARLILTQARTVEDAHALAEYAVGELNAAVKDAELLKRP